MQTQVMYSPFGRCKIGQLSSPATRDGSSRANCPNPQKARNKPEQAEAAATRIFFCSFSASRMGIASATWFRNIALRRLMKRASGNGRENVCIFVFDLIKFGLDRVARYGRIG